MVMLPLYLWEFAMTYTTPRVTFVQIDSQHPAGQSIKFTRCHLLIGL
jgi:hypothetical protein